MTVNNVGSNPAAALNALTATGTIAPAGAVSDPDNDGDVRRGGDSARISGPGKLFAELQQLQSQDPAKFQKVTADIAGQLKTAAGSTSGAQADFLTSLADKFQTASTTGDASGLQPAHHRHHHPHTTAYNQQGQPVPLTAPTTAPSGTDLTQLFTNISDEVARAVGA